MESVKIKELIESGKKCDTCLYCQNRGFKLMCEKMVPIGGQVQPLPEKNICEEWTEDTI